MCGYMSRYVTRYKPTSKRYGFPRLCISEKNAGYPIEARITRREAPLIENSTIVRKMKVTDQDVHEERDPYIGRIFWLKCDITRYRDKIS